MCAQPSWLLVVCSSPPGGRGHFLLLLLRTALADCFSHRAESTLYKVCQITKPELKGKGQTLREPVAFNKHLSAYYVLGFVPSASQILIYFILTTVPGRWCS